MALPSVARRQLPGLDARTDEEADPRTVLAAGHDRQRLQLKADQTLAVQLAMRLCSSTYGWICQLILAIHDRAAGAFDNKL